VEKWCFGDDFSTAWLCEGIKNALAHSGEYLI